MSVQRRLESGIEVRRDDPRPQLALGQTIGLRPSHDPAELGPVSQDLEGVPIRIVVTDLESDCFAKPQTAAEPEKDHQIEAPAVMVKPVLDGFLLAGRKDLDDLVALVRPLRVLLGVEGELAASSRGIGEDLTVL